MAHNYNKNMIQIFFGQRTTLNGPLSRNQALIIPANDRWNDFGFRSKIDYRYRTSNDKIVETFGFLGFLDNSETKDLADFVSRSESFILAPDINFHFFTMLPNMEAYREIVKELGVAEAVEFLLAVRDLVAISEFEPKTNWLKLAVNTEVFAMSFTRESESYFAFKNAASILHGLNQENIGVLSSQLNINFKLPNFVNDHELTFNFQPNHILPKRIAVIIGENGIGKSQTLNRIVRSALKNSNELRDGDNNRPLINRILAFAPTNEAESVFPSERLKNPNIWYRRFSLNRSRRNKRNDYLSDLIVQLARSPESIKDNSRFAIFTNSLKTLSNSEQIALTTKNNETIYYIADLVKVNEKNKLIRFSLIDKTKEPQRIIEGKSYPLSSGEVSFLKFAAQASLHIENGSLLLLDEPETHLHPNFISKFVLLLDKLLESTGSAAIIATHSVYFVQEVFREQVTVLRKNENRIESEKPRLRTFGGDVGAISFFVFGEDEPTALADLIKKKIIDTNQKWEEIYNTYKDELSNEFLLMLRQELEGNL